ncbi:MAG: pyruvate kinase [Coriobacteriia bacterium]|nr:pyruvate kinase [Coriobacteriia bacterium]
MKKLRKTKIICTMGPASSSEDMIKKLIGAGMNCARINCSHGSAKDRQPVIATLKKVRKELDYPLAILMDTKGPEFRLKTFKDDKVTVEDGAKFTFTTDDVEGDKTKVSVTYEKLCDDLEKGDIILVNDGLVKFEVEKVTDHNVHCKTIIGGELSNNKSMNFPGKDLSVEFLSETDKQDLLHAIKNDVDYVACSFVSNAEDMKSIRDFMYDNGGSKISLIAKIENQSGINNLDEICKYCDGIMVARGDLGVEIDYDKLPIVQKEIIRSCLKKGKLAITSTEMLESMIEHARPTRAEISDVANAVYDGTAAVMLSGETAVGKYPVEAVEAMAKIAFSAEKAIPYEELIKYRATVVEGRTVDAIAKATCTVAIDVEAKSIVNISASGFTSELISNFRPPMYIITITSNKKEFYKLALYWGVSPLYGTYKDEYSSLDILNIAKTCANKILDLEDGDKFVLNSGWQDDEIGYTNSLLVEVM